MRHFDYHIELGRRSSDFNGGNDMMIRMLILAIALLAVGGCQTTPAGPGANGSGQPNGNGNGNGGATGQPNGQGDPNTGQNGTDRLVVSPVPSPDKMDMDIQWGKFFWDDDPYADGVTVKLRMWRLDRPLAFALQQGLVEFTVYEGAIEDDALASTIPFHIWRYTARGLNKAGGKKVIIGWQYEVQLDWQDNVPRTDEITLSARIVRPGKAALYAKPAKIRLIDK